MGTVGWFVAFLSPLFFSSSRAVWEHWAITWTTSFEPVVSRPQLRWATVALRRCFDYSPHIPQHDGALVYWLRYVQVYKSFIVTDLFLVDFSWFLVDLVNLFIDGKAVYKEINQQQTPCWMFKMNWQCFYYFPYISSQVLFCFWLLLLFLLLLLLFAFLLFPDDRLGDLSSGTLTSPGVI